VAPPSGRSDLILTKRILSRESSPTLRREQHRSAHPTSVNSQLLSPIENSKCFRLLRIPPRTGFEWTIELAIQVDGEERRFEVDNNGQPFRTSVRIHELSRYERVWYYDFEEGDFNRVR
jgi:hypothetical protein